MSVTTVRPMEGRELHPGADERGVRLFPDSEVRSVAERRIQQPVSKRDDEREVADRVFELFRSGFDMRIVVNTARNIVVEPLDVDSRTLING